MNKEKQQIEEMKKWSAIKEMELAIRNKTESCQTCTWYKNGVCDDSCELAEDNQKICVDLYNAGYRKQSENTVELPCKVGDKVWCISNYTKPKEFQITILTMSENHYSFVIEADKGVYRHYCDKDSVGKYVFFTKEEAEKSLAEMKGGAE